MKWFYRLPLWLRLVIPATLVTVCVTINAIAFTEIWHSVQAARQAPVLTTSAPKAAGISSDLQRQQGPSEQKQILSEQNQPEQNQPEQNQPAQNQPAQNQPAQKLLAKDQPEASATNVTPAPLIDPEATIDEAKAKLAPQATAVVAPAKTQKYGHLSYPVQSSDDLSLVASYAEGESQRDEYLHPDAAAALHKMIAAARANGIWIIPASGFRSLEQQRSLFSNQTLMKGSPEAAATVSAPPGYSEHHTGYAVDLADGALSQDNDISIAFAQSPAYAWLSENAAQFGFELSFPEDNSQGIAFEPWHWRYIGTEEAQQIFSAPSESSEPSSEQSL